MRILEEIKSFKAEALELNKKVQEKTSQTLGPLATKVLTKIKAEKDRVVKKLTKPSGEEF